MRKKMVIGNWKMHGSHCELDSLITKINKNADTYSEVIEIAVLPPFIFLPLIQDALINTPITMGAQNLYLGKEGAFTGEISGPMLAEYGCKYVLVGHSERRILFNEDLTLVAAKFKAAQEAKLIPILCVGESLAQREAGLTEQVIKEQIDSIIQSNNIDALQNAVIAYEPIWAIGTGLSASQEQAQEVHVFIRKQIAEEDSDVAKKICILYGGSVKADNANALFAMPDIDGGLVGGASLNADSFLKICAAAT